MRLVCHAVRLASGEYVPLYCGDSPTDGKGLHDVIATGLGVMPANAAAQAVKRLRALAKALESAAGDKGVSIAESRVLANHTAGGELRAGRWVV